MTSGFHLVFLLSLTGGLLISRSASAEGKAPACPSGWTAYGSRCFFLYDCPKTMAEAELTCVSLGGNLASIHSLEENNFLINLVHKRLGNKAQFWFGFFDSIQEGKWMWTDGSMVDFTRWAKGEPGGNEGCTMNNHKGIPEWDDYPCSQKRPFLCARRH